MDMSWLKDIKWDEIFKAAVASELGLIGLSTVILSFLVYVFFRNSQQNWPKFLAILVFIAGVAVFSTVLRKEVILQTKQTELAELLASCKSKASNVSNSCRAYDKSGFHSSPSASCNLDIAAPSGWFFADRTVNVVSQFYRNSKGPTALAAMLPREVTIDGITVISHFIGEIGCTNSAGTGRTCESKATISAKAYPAECVQFHKELRR